MTRTSDRIKHESTEKPPLSLYSGKVMHARLDPVSHRFSYKMTSMLIDLDRLQEADSATAIFSVNRPNLVAFHEKHHGPRDGTSLRSYIDATLYKAGVTRPARVELLCYPTVLGYTFNPLSVYFCYDDTGDVTALVYQVHNTFGQSHCYVEPVRQNQRSEAGIRQSRAKCFYVSPFMEMAMTYKFRIRPPADTVALRILEFDAKEPVLAATFHGNRNPANLNHFLRSLLQTIGITWKVTVGIHFEALRLWLKGLRPVDRPAPPLPESFPDKIKSGRWNRPLEEKA
ncbi:MAG: DUF1365 domain-containing protein [Rhizobiaceae bacterium]